jgi:hypothetical protein
VLACILPMVAKQEAASRHRPIATIREGRSEAGAREPEVRRTSEMRLAVARSPRQDDLDFYADVPCTD